MTSSQTASTALSDSASRKMSLTASPNNSAPPSGPPLFNWYFAFVAGPDKRKQRRLSFDDGPKPSLFGRVISAVTVLVVLALLAVLLFS